MLLNITVKSRLGTADRLKFVQFSETAALGERPLYRDGRLYVPLRPVEPTLPMLSPTLAKRYDVGRGTDDDYPGTPTRN